MLEIELKVRVDSLDPIRQNPIPGTPNSRENSMNTISITTPRTATSGQRTKP